MKVQIKSLRGVNCGPLKDVTIDFTTNGDVRPVTLLAGANGSGKTTALELMFSLIQRIQQQGPVIGLPSATYAQAEYARLDLLADGQPFCVVVGSKPKGEREPESQIRLLPVNDGHISEAVGEAATSVREAISSQWWRPLDEVRPSSSIGSVIYTTHQRGITSHTGSQIVKEVTIYNWTLKYVATSSFENSLDSYLIWLDYAQPDEYKRTVQFMNSLAFDGKIFAVSRTELKAMVRTSDDHIHGIDQLSSGEQNILEIMTGLYRYLLPNSIVLIDEIENSLHPAFQHKLGNALLKMQQEIPFQLIATTHSREFLKIFGAENTLILSEF